jgi:hypothetical protein
VAVGIGGILDWVVPFDCAETLAPGCAERLEAKGLDLEYILHATESVLGVVAMVLSFPLLAHGTWRRPGWTWVARLAVVLGAIYVLLAIDQGIQALPALETGRGVVQRFGQVLIGVWLVALSVALVRAPYAPPADQAAAGSSDRSRSASSATSLST